jgi:hypothetical protein
VIDGVYAGLLIVGALVDWLMPVMPDRFAEGYNVALDDVTSEIADLRAIQRNK